MATRYTAANSECSYRAATGITGKSYSVMGWVYAVSLPALNDFYSVFHLACGDVDDESATEFTNSGAQLKLTLWDGTADTLSAALAIETWYHVALVRESATVLKLYINGVYSHLGGVTDPGEGDGGLSLGVWDIDVPIDYADIRMCGVKVYNKSCALAEVQREVNSFTPKDWTSLVGWYPMLKADRVTDWSGNGRTLTEVNTPTDEDPPPISWGARYYQAVKSTSVVPSESVSPSASSSASLSVSPSVSPSASASMSPSASASASTAPSELEQEGFRWRNDDGNEAAATWKQDQDICTNFNKLKNIRIRFVVNASGDPGPLAFKLQYKQHDAVDWRDMPKSV